MRIGLRVNGELHEVEAEPGRLLVSFLREDLGLTGTHVGCGAGQCGACTVLLDGRAVKSCTVLAAQADGRDLLTIEGLARGDRLHPLQEAFSEEHGLQCGFCTPGMILAAWDLLERTPDPDEEEIRQAIGGNTCRCTGYHNVVRAIRRAARGAGAAGGAEGRPARSGARQEDRRLVTGRGSFVDDLRRPGLLHLRVLRSPHAHARLGRVDVARAATLPGVVAVLTGEELRGLTPPMPGPSGLPGLEVPEHRALATGKVRFVGEAIAAVVADEPGRALDALEAIEVELEPLPAVVDPEEAMAEEAPVLHEELGDNIAYRMVLGPDLQEALRSADRVLRQRLTTPRLLPSPMETRGVLACPRPVEGRLDVWISTQAPHLVRTQLAAQLGLPEHRLRVVAPDVGGAFGSKANLYPEELLAALLAMRLGRPVKWIESRPESMVATSHGRGQVVDLEAGIREDGRVIALGLRIIADLGAHHHVMTPMAALQTVQLMTGCYRIPAARAEVIGVFTSKTPTDPYRGFGRAEAAYYIERLMDRVARELDLDPALVRHRNFIPPEAFPYRSPMGHVLDSGRYGEALERALEILGYDDVRREQQRLRREGRSLGVGLATFVWRAGFPSAAVPPGLDFLQGGWESATVRVSPSGKVTVLTGTSPHGQGGESSLGRMAAEALGVPLEDVRVLHGDTDVSPYGMGSMGSRGLAVGGSAVFLALEKVRDKALRIAAHALGSRPGEVVLERGRFAVPGSPERSLTLAEVAARAFRASGLPEGLEPGLEASAAFEPPNFNSPFGAHLCVVEVDVETGQVHIRRYVAVDDCGRAIHPAIVEGQVHGGIAQGLGEALLEEAVHDRSGQLRSGTLADYLLPGAPDLPAFETDRTETPTPVNPLGAKGVGESGTMGAPPALVNAVLDALAPLGVRHLEMPLRPERVWRAIREAGA